MEFENPKRLNLTTSGAFRNWLDANPLRESSPVIDQSSTLSLLEPQLLLQRLDKPFGTLQETSTVNSPNLTNTIPHQTSTVLAQAFRETVEAPLLLNKDTVPPAPEPAVTNIMNVALQETMEPPVPEVDSIERADEIIAELMGNRDLQAFMDRMDVDLAEETDEGITLNMYDEIEGDIEPFDYYLEVEPFD